MMSCFEETKIAYHTLSQFLFFTNIDHIIKPQIISIHIYIFLVLINYFTCLDSELAMKKTDKSTEVM